MNFIKELLSASLVVSVLVASTFAVVEPGLASAVEDQVVVSQSVTSGISISSPSDVAMTALSITQLSAVASSTWNVISNNSTGWSVTVTASSTAGCTDNDGLGVTDALCAGTVAFDDLATTTRSAWSVTDAYAFGFSASGMLKDANTNITGWGTNQATSDCSTGGSETPDSGLLWQGFDGENTAYEIASSTTVTDQGGSQISLCLATEQQGVWAPSGTYYATTTATAVNN